ncbi:MAG: hypothetical protein M0R76_01665 [Proteobacteria bacterium]|nr:hypothetical protein [Pseudomonadota bacterium]
MFRWRHCMGLFCLCTAISLAATAGDFGHIASDELAEEADARRQDLQRTEERLQQLEATLATLQAQQHATEEELRALTETLEAHAAILYRISRGGKALRYLMSAETDASFLKRANTLKRLFTSQVKARREKGLHLSSIEADIAQREAEIGTAQGLAEELRETIAELEAAVQQRGAASPQLSARY